MLKPNEEILKSTHFNILDFTIIKTIGKGSFGKVYLINHKVTKSLYAMKELPKKSLNSNKTSLIPTPREIQIISSLSHPNIIKIEDIIETSSRFLIIMEYCEKGELLNYIIKKHRLSSKEASKFFYQIINGINYLHSHNIIHRDIKPENILLSSNNTIKIIDFGLSNYSVKDNLLNTQCGSLCYAAPEIFKGIPYRGETCDIWSIGVVLYTMVCGYLPFMDDDNDSVYKKIKECRYSIPNWISMSVRRIIRKMIVMDPKYRIKMNEIRKESFYAEGRYNYYAEMQEKDNINIEGKKKRNGLSVKARCILEEVKESALRNWETMINSLDGNKRGINSVKGNFFITQVQISQMKKLRQNESCKELLRKYIYEKKKKCLIEVNERKEKNRNDKVLIATEVNNGKKEKVIVFSSMKNLRSNEKVQKDDNINNNNNIILMNRHKNHHKKPYIIKEKYFYLGKYNLKLKKRIKDKIIKLNTERYLEKMFMHTMRNNKIDILNLNAYKIHKSTSKIKIKKLLIAN